MAKQAETPDPEPEPDGEPGGDGGDDEEAQWQRLAPRFKALQKEAFNEVLDEMIASHRDSDSEEDDEPETGSAGSARPGRPAPAARRTAGRLAAAVKAAPKLGGREAPAKGRSGILGLFVGN